MAGSVPNTIEDTLLSLPTEMLNAANAVGGNLIPAANNLLLAFAAIALSWLGIRIMMEKNLSDQILIGDALKLFLLLGMAKAILINHAFLLDLLQRSVDYLSAQIGVTNGLQTFTDNFVVKPIRAVYDAMGRAPLEPDIPDSVISRIVATAKTTLKTVLNFFTTDLVLIAMAVFFTYLGVIAGITAAIIVALAEVLFAIVASIGVICVPFLVLPKLDKVFWSWIDGLFYALAVKLTVAGTVAIIAQLQLANIPSLVTTVDGIKMMNYAAAFHIVLYAVLAIALLKIAFQIAGMIAGARFSLKAETRLSL